MATRKPVRWHIALFLAPAVLVYTAIMIIPLFGTLNLSLFNEDGGVRVFVGLGNFATLFGEPLWSEAFWNALGNNAWFFLIHMLVQNPIGIALAAILSTPRLRMAAFYRTAIFIPTILSFVIVGFVWKLILSPIWGIAPGMLDMVGLKSLFAPWLGKEAYALTTLALISVWQFVGIPMMLIYAALLSIPDEVLEAAEMDGAGPVSRFWYIMLPHLARAITVVVLIQTIFLLGIFGEILVTTNGGPGTSSTTLPYLIYKEALLDFDVGTAAAGGVVAVILANIVAFFLMRAIGKNLDA